MPCAPAHIVCAPVRTAFSRLRQACARVRTAFSGMRRACARARKGCAPMGKAFAGVRMPFARPRTHCAGVLLPVASPTFRFHRSDELGPRVVEVEREGEPPYKIVGEAEDEGRGRPRAAPDELGEADGAEQLAEEPDGGEEPAALGRARDLEIDDPVEADDHAEAGEYLRVVLQGQAREAEEPLRVERRVEAPRDVVSAGRAEGRAVKLSPGDQAFAPSARHGQPPPGSPSAA